VTRDVRILWLYPDILNLHGDRGNVMALVRICCQIGVNPLLIRVDRLEDPIDFDGADLVVVGPGELAVMGSVVERLRPYAQKLSDMVDAGKPVFVAGTSAAIVARETVRTDSSRIPGLGLVDMVVVEREEILGDDLILDAEGQELGGMQIRMTDLRLDPSQKPFAAVLYGVGNADRPDIEGARRSNLVVTNLLGPALTKNPWFARTLIDQALLCRYGEATFVPDDDLWAFERKSASVIRAYNATKTVLPGTLRRL